MKIGTNKAFTKFANKDPNPGIPFVDAYPPSAGVTYWMVCAIILGIVGALLFLGVGK